MSTTTEKVPLKQRLMVAAHDLIMERGYPNTVVDDICERAGASKGSFYHHFKSKDDLATKLLLSLMDQACEALEGGDWIETKEPLPRLMGFLDQVIEKSDTLWGRGCVVGVLATDAVGSGEELKRAVIQAFDAFRERFAELFKVAAKRAKTKLGRKAPKSEELARNFIHAIEGGAIMSRVHGSAEPIHEALRGYKQYIELLVSE